MTATSPDVDIGVTLGFEFLPQTVPLTDAVSVGGEESAFNDTRSTRWLYHHETVLSRAGTGGTEDTVQAERFLIDSRSRRVVSEGDHLIAQCGINTLGTFTDEVVVVVVNCRLLFRETRG